MRKKMRMLCFAATVWAVSLSAANVQLPARAIFYYAWFPQTWSVEGDHVFYNPTLGYYDSGKTNIVDAHIQALNYAKIDVGIVSWWGPKRSNEETRIPLILNRTIAKGSNIKWAFYYEQAGFPENYDLSASGIRSNLNYLSRYTNHAACAKINGKPVIFVYNINDDPSKVAANWKSASNGKWYVVLKVFKDWAKVADQPDAWHQYGPSTAASSVGDSYTISPGFWRADMATPDLSRDLNRWAGNVRDMVASGKKWQLVTTFNEWGEGTALESAQEWSSSSGYGKYLDLLHNDGNTVTPTGTNGAAYVTQVVPSSMVAGKTTNVTVRMKNTGTAAWKIADGHKLGSQNVQDNTTWGINRVDVPSGVTVAVGQEYNFSFSITAPSTPGTYNFQWKMVDDVTPNQGWFGALTANKMITVTAATSSLPAVGSIITLKAVNGNYVSATFSTNNTLIANKTTVSNFERFKVVNATNCVALQCMGNSKFVSINVPNGSQPMLANRPTIGSYEKFKLVQSGSQIAISSVLSTNYVSAVSNGVAPLQASQTYIGSYEKFTWKVE